MVRKQRLLGAAGHEDRLSEDGPPLRQVCVCEKQVSFGDHMPIAKVAAVVLQAASVKPSRRCEVGEIEHRQAAVLESGSFVRHSLLELGNVTKPDPLSVDALERGACRNDKTSREGAIVVDLVVERMQSSHDRDSCRRTGRDREREKVVAREGERGHANRMGAAVLAVPR